MIKPSKVEPEQVEVQSRAELRDWLTVHGGQSEPIWLVTYKKKCPDQYISMEAIVEELICFGWIDSRIARIDDDRTMLLISPRRSGSAWSKVNKDKIERLIASNLMAPPGLAIIEAAKADGSWTRLDEVESLVEPKDLAKALAQKPTAKDYWEAFPRSARRSILEWIYTAKTSETRERRIEETVRLAAENIRAK